MGKASKYAGVALGIAGLAVAAGCSSGEAEGHGTVTNAGGLATQQAKANVSATWKFKTKDGCKGTIQQVQVSDVPLLSKVQNYTGKTLHALKTDVDFRGASDSVDSDESCGPEVLLINKHTGSKQGESDLRNLVDNEMDKHEDDGGYNRGVDLSNKVLRGLASADPGTKSTTYSVFTHKIKPFTNMTVAPAGDAAGTVEAHQV